MQGSWLQIDNVGDASTSVAIAQQLVGDDVNRFALQLLQFVEDNVREAVLDKSYRRALLAEADGALAVLVRTLRRRAPELYPFVSFSLDFDLLQISLDNPEPTAKLLGALNEILKARKVFT